jgi:thymidylate synthase (FAD)
MGSDQSVVRAARISNGAVMPDWRGAADERLIRFLADHGHMTPFEHATFTFYVKAPIFVVREWQRHRSFSYNELSGRYKKLVPEFYIPDQMRGQDANNKQGSVPDAELEPYYNGLIRSMLQSYEEAFNTYQNLLSAGVAREIARAVLPLGIYTEMYVTGNLRNWAHWYSLRGAPDAQLEIQLYAQSVGDVLEHEMPLSWAALAR